MADVRRATDPLDRDGNLARVNVPRSEALARIDHNSGAPHQREPAEQPADVHTPPPTGARGFSTVLRNRYFLRLWMAQLISQTIMNAANYGLIIVIATRSQSYLATGFAIVAFALPAAVFGAPAGVMVDRLNRRTVLWVSNILRAGASVLFAVSLLVDQRALLPAYALSFFIAMVGQFFAPAEGASIPLLVHQEELINALSLFNITFTMAQALGLIVLGPLILLFMPAFTIGVAPHSIEIRSIESLFMIVALLYLVCVGLILSIPVRRLRSRHVTGPHQHHRPSETRQLRGIWTGIVEVWHFIRRDHHLLASVLQLCIGGTVIAVIAMIAPGFVVAFFHRPPELAAMVFVPAGVGLVLGSMLTPNIVRRIHFSRTIAIGFVTLAICMALLTVVRAIAQAAQPHDWWNSWAYLIIAIGLTFFIGVALDFITVPAQTVMQERSPDFIKGRVLAVQGMVLNAATVPFVPLMGLAADHLGIAQAIAILAVIVAATGLGSVYYGAKVTNEPGDKGHPLRLFKRHE